MPEIIRLSTLRLRNHYLSTGDQESGTADKVDSLIERNKGVMADKVSALFGTSSAIGKIMGPMLSGLLVQEYEYRESCDILFWITLVVCVSNFALNSIAA
jgi:hypothetical protein